MLKPAILKAMGPKHREAALAAATHEARMADTLPKKKEYSFWEGEVIVIDDPKAAAEPAAEPKGRTFKIKPRGTAAKAAASGVNAEGEEVLDDDMFE